VCFISQFLQYLGPVLCSRVPRLSFFCTSPLSHPTVAFSVSVLVQKSFPLVFPQVVTPLARPFSFFHPFYLQLQALGATAESLVRELVPPSNIFKNEISMLSVYVSPDLCFLSNWCMFLFFDTPFPKTPDMRLVSPGDDFPLGLLSHFFLDLSVSPN